MNLNAVFFNFFFTFECKSKELTEEMKLDAEVVTVALAEEELCWRALEKKFHMTALQVRSRPPHSSRRGIWSWKHIQVKEEAAVNYRWVTHQSKIFHRCSGWLRSGLGFFP